MKKPLKIRHISFDIWNTLIAPNPKFKQERIEYLSKELSLSQHEVEYAYRNIKDGADLTAEIHGICYPSKILYEHLLSSLGRQDIDWWTVRQGIEEIFAKNPPHVLPEIIDSLRRLQEKFTLSIASNTNFIRGEALNNVVLEKWGIDWSFQVFSDKINRPKPHIDFWLSVIKLAGVVPSEILHIGDNKICDGGCVHANIQFKYANNPNELLAILNSLDRVE